MEPLNAKERELAARLHALEKVDKGVFQPRARLLQAIWRDEMGLEPGTSRGKVRGARIAMPEAKETLANYLTETIREVVRTEVLDPEKRKGKLYGQPRIWDNLLSSQPLCFNLFGELQQDLELATRVFEAVSEGRMARVTAIEFEHSPGRGDATYTGDSSAFDVFVEGVGRSGERMFVGTEVKYHENLKLAPAEHKTRYDELADAMGCFLPERRESLKESPLEQIWRDHLLAGALLEAGDYNDGMFVFLYPADNEFCSDAVERYQSCLSDHRSFEAWTLDGLVDLIARSAPEAGWPVALRRRYLDFGRIGGAMTGGVEL